MPEDSSAAANSFTAAHYFPSRRRVWQACTNCRARKTRCDAAKPKCSLCMTQGVECVYQDSQQPKIEHNTRILLERIQLLEDRIFSSSGGLTAPEGVNGEVNQNNKRPYAHSQEESAVDQVQASTSQAGEGEAQIPIPLSHTANADHVVKWPVVRQLLAQSDIRLPQQPSVGEVHSSGATDVFFLDSNPQTLSRGPPSSWRLFTTTPSQSEIAQYRDFIFGYFDEVNVFYPMLSLGKVLERLDRVLFANTEELSVSSADYCLLLLILSLGRLVRSGLTRTSLQPWSHEKTLAEQDANGHHPDWEKGKVLLGYISAEYSVEAAQCSMLASIYAGAQGLVSESFHWAHATAVKCEIIAKRLFLTSKDSDAFPEDFRRLYWVAYIYEGDFVSEVSVTLPSGISRYEDVVPYPANSTFSRQIDPPESPATDAFRHAVDVFEKTEELVAFQISTNGAIRRFLNRVNSVVYDSKDQFRMTRSSYANWLLRITEDLWSYHDAIYKNLPNFLLRSQPQQNRQSDGEPPWQTKASGTESIRNNPWNVRRLEGRFYAGQYIIHRPFLEYVLLNLDHFQTHPCREAILERGRLCLKGCSGFIKVFDMDPANSITCLFASGMVTFTMVIILRVATTCQVFASILLPDMEEVIATGKRNLRRFSSSIVEFRWHLEVLNALDRACQK